jgi:hypothetical protein
MFAKQAISKQVVGDITKAYKTTYISSVATAGFEITTKRTMTAFSHMSDNDPEVLEKEKQKTLSKEGKEWNEKLASHSEAAVSYLLLKHQLNDQKTNFFY